MYGRYGQGLFTMENATVMYLSIISDIVLGESSFKITLRFLTFYQFGVRIWDPIPVDRYQNPSGYVPRKTFSDTTDLLLNYEMSKKKMT